MATESEKALRVVFIRRQALYILIRPTSSDGEKDAAALGIANGWLTSLDMDPQPEVRYFLTEDGRAYLEALPDDDGFGIIHIGPM